MNFVIGLVVSLSSMLGGFAAIGGHLPVLWQPFELIIICGSALGTFIVANPLYTIKDTGKGIMEAMTGKGPKKRDYLDILSLMHALMREMRTKSRGDVETHVDNPDESELFKQYPKLLKNHYMIHFICDYCRLIIVGNVRPHEIEALMDEEINTIMRDKQKPYFALTSVADSFPALGIVAAVLGVIHAMGALDQSPEVLGGLIGSSLVGTFAGIFLSYGVVNPLAYKIKTIREKQARVYVIIKQSLLAFMNGAMPQIAVEHGRKTISVSERPSIDDVENETISGGSGGGEAAKKAA